MVDAEAGGMQGRTAEQREIVMADDNTNDAQAHDQPPQPNPASPRAMM
ncbi:MAG: hypothetical protein M3Q65_12325 [Chloroflexota bacterium]|nr:hypothetical protein [Chloroflexota bacterium]